MKNRSRTPGFTLIEVLIAVTLVGLLSLGMMLAIRIALNSQIKANARIVANRKVLGAQRALEEELNGFMPVLSAWTPPNSSGGRQLIPFFGGDPGAMRFVSSYSLNGADRGFPVILEMLVLPGEQGRGARLIVNEYPWNGPLSGGAFIAGLDTTHGGPRAIFVPIEVGSRSFVLADRLQYCRMSYLGLNRTVAPPEEQWRTDWEESAWPLAVRVEMAPVNDEPASLHPMTVTTRIHADRTPYVTYAEYSPQ